MRQIYGLCFNYRERNEGSCGMHQNLKIISVSLYAATLEIQDDLSLCIHHLLDEIRCFRTPHIYRLTAVLYNIILYNYVLNVLFVCFLLLKELQMIFQANQTT